MPLASCGKAVTYAMHVRSSLREELRKEQAARKGAESQLAGALATLQQLSQAEALARRFEAELQQVPRPRCMFCSVARAALRLAVPCAAAMCDTLSPRRNQEGWESLVPCTLVPV